MSSKMKPKLSKGILEMKFMKRTKEKTIKEEEEAEGREMYSNEITKEMIHGSSKFIIEPSYVYCENLIDGRLSFRGMNPEIERLMEIDGIKKNGEMTKEISDTEMLKTYNNMTISTNKKFESKKRRIIDDMKKTNKKMKFIKPKEDD